MNLPQYCKFDAHRHILEKTVEDARRLGVIKDMTDLKFGNKALL